MKKMVIICDKCQKEIKDKPARLTFYDTTRESEDADQTLYDPKEDYCIDCVTELIALIDNFKPHTEEKETKSKKEPKKKSQNRKKTDVGKIWALHDAGWKLKDIALDAGVAVSTVHRVLHQERPIPEYEKEKAADLEQKANCNFTCM